MENLFTLICIFYTWIKIIWKPKQFLRRNNFYSLFCKKKKSHAFYVTSLIQACAVTTIMDNG